MDDLITNLAFKLKTAETAILNVRKLHKVFYQGEILICTECGEMYPCRTIKRLESNQDGD
jgi:hypothetical protein